jgi:hypothetical protein
MFITDIITNFRNTFYIYISEIHTRNASSSPGPRRVLPGPHETGIVPFLAGRLAVVSKARAPELGRFSTRKFFYSKVLRSIYVDIHVDRIILPIENCSTSAK